MAMLPLLNCMCLARKVHLVHLVRRAAPAQQVRVPRVHKDRKGQQAHKVMLDLPALPGLLAGKGRRASKACRGRKATLVQRG